MNTILRRVLMTAILAAAVVIAGHGAAQAATHCSLVSVTNGGANGEVVEAYNVFSSTNGSNTYTLTFNLSCTGNGSATLLIYFFGRSSTSYVEPYLSGPNGSQLTFDLCLPGAAGCSASSTFWNGSNAYSIACTSASDCQNKASHLTGPVYAAPGQNVYVGTFSQYTTALYFSMAST